jgi:hypothetical protein
MTPACGRCGLVRQLALGLAGNAADADDLVQDSRIAAWRRAPIPARRRRVVGLIERRPVGSELTVTVRRGAERRSLVVKVEARRE